MAGHRWTVGLVGVVFAAGMAAGLLFPGRAPSPGEPPLIRDMDVSLGESAPFLDPNGSCKTPVDSALFGPMDRARPDFGSREECASIDLHPPQFALHVQAFDDSSEEVSAAPKSEGPQLHPPDAPKGSAVEPRSAGPELPQRTAEKDPDLFPGRLVPPPEASRVPGESSSRHEAVLEALIDQELPDANAQEREVWLDRIRGMDPSSARYLLELRRRVGSAAEEAMRRSGEPRPLHSDLANRPSHLPPPAWPKPIREAMPYDDEEPSEFGPLPPQPEAVDPLGDESVITRPLAAAMSAVRQARGVIIHNVANARTDGFKKISVQLTDSSYLSLRRQSEFGPDPRRDDETPDEDAVFGQGASLRTSIDFTQGPIRKTGRALDIAIDGEGWLQVQLGEEIGYTRCGRLFVDRRGELVIRADGRAFVIEPTVCVPDDTTKIRISEAGTIVAEQRGQEEPAQIGQLQLARFVGENALAPSGSGLFRAEPGAKPMVGSPNEVGYGKVRQACLEGSNVDIKSELAELRNLSELSKALIEAVRLMQDDSDDPEEPEVFRMSKSCDSDCCRSIGACGDCPHCQAKSSRGACCDGEACCQDKSCDKGDACCKEGSCCPEGNCKSSPCAKGADECSSDCGRCAGAAKACPKCKKGECRDAESCPEDALKH